jgi:hypothetical protein
MADFTQSRRQPMRSFKKFRTVIPKINSLRFLQDLTLSEHLFMIPVC